MPNLVEIAWPTFGAILLWREASKRLSVQSCLHRLGAPAVALLQWYVLFFAGMFVVLAWTSYEIFWKYRAMDEETIKHNFLHIWSRNLTGTFNATDPESELGLRNETTVPLWIRRLSLVSQVACLPTFLVALSQARQVVTSGAELKKQKDEPLPWMPSQLVNTVLYVIAMPTVFSMMALRSSCRIWALITGRAQRSHELPWEEVVMREMGRYRGDMELAGAFQFLVVLSFSRLSSHYLYESKFFEELVKGGKDEEFKKRAEEYRQQLKHPAFLAVYAFCLVGVVRCCLKSLVAEAHVYQHAAMVADVISQEILTMVDTVFVGVTILCVINMIFICRMQDIRDNLGNANLKFQGTRALIIIAQVQLHFISAFQVGSDSFEANKDRKEMMSMAVRLLFNLKVDVQEWTFNKYSAHLLHTSLLKLECLFIVIMNFAIWEADVKSYADGAAVSVHSRSTSTGYAPLGQEEDDDEDESEDQEHQMCGCSVIKDAEFLLRSRRCLGFGA